jgi:hypothetical protein
MGWRYRRALNLGPLRLNLSHSGIGYSAGTRGLKIGQDSKRRKYLHLSVPRTGIFKKSYFPNAPAKTGKPSGVATPPQSTHGASAPSAQRWAAYLTGAVLLYFIIRAIF